MNRSGLAMLGMCALIGMPLAGGAEEPAQDGVATLVLVNGRILTAEGWAESLAIRGDRILSAGRESEIRRDAGTRVIDLGGKTVLPGFSDQHVHPVYGGIVYSGADYTNCRITQGLSIEPVLATVAGCVSRVSGSDWVTGGQWDASALGGVPDRAMLDKVSPANPVLLFDTSGHSAWANSAALRIAGVTAETPMPEGGIIERDGDGEPTGILRESAIELVRRHVPQLPLDIVRKSLEWSLRTMLSEGITSYTEASAGFVAGAERELQAYQQLADAGRLKQRVRICLNWVPEDAASESLIRDRRQHERDRLALDCVKIFLDGVPTDSHTAAMLEPYAGTVEGRDDPASRYGMLLVAPPALNAAVTRFDGQGLTVKFHAAGDAAVRAGLDAIEAARRANGMNSLHHNVGHCTFVSPQDVSRAAPLNATFELSPYLWSPSPINADIARAVGDERIQRAWPFRELLDAGQLVVAGSDWAVVPSVSPWFAIEVLVTRERPGGSPDSFGKPQAIRIAEAIDLFTVNAARHMNAEDRLGRIAPGYLADLIVIDRNPFEIPVTELHETKVLMTFIGGEVVFDRTSDWPESGK